MFPDDCSRSPPEQEQLTQDFVPQGRQDVVLAMYIETLDRLRPDCLMNGEIA
jgi:hypothetical protein